MAMQETERCGELLARQLGASQAAAQGLGPLVQCCALALAHARSLHASHALALHPRLMRRLWPVCQEVATPLCSALSQCWLQRKISCAWSLRMLSFMHGNVLPVQSMHGTD